MSRSSSVLRQISAPAVVVGGLATALTLTAFADPSARADPGDPRDKAHLASHVDVTELRVLDWALWNVSLHYVDPSRINPDAMTLAGLEALEAAIPEVLVEPVDGGKRVRVRVGTEDREFDAQTSALWTVGPHVREVFRFVVKAAELDETEQREVEYAIVEGVLSTLDPHTNLLRPTEFDDMKTSTKGSFGGLGIEVGMRDGRITVVRVLDGNPAAKAGIVAGDRIVQIEDQSAVTMPINDAVGLLRGAPGTAVTLWIERDGLAKPKKYVVTRDVITLESAVGYVLPGIGADGQPGEIGLVQIPRNFSQTTAKETRAALDEFRKRGVKGVVIDMRENPGGLLNAAVDVANAFLSEGTIVATVGASSPRDESRADARYDYPDVPVVVLVDQGSASATEIVAGALRNLDRAVILGRRTFGKGSVQVLNDRRVGDKELALKLTIAQYLTPGDVSIQSVGVSPDIETIPVWVSDENVYYYNDERFDLVREESLAAHLQHGTAKPQPVTAGPLYYLSQGSLADRDAAEDELLGLAKSDDPKVTELLRDPEIRMARDLALWAPSSNRREILARIDEFVSTQEAIESLRIERALAARKIDWKAGPPPAEGKSAQLRVEVKTDKRGDVIKGGESAKLTMTVTNEGDTPAYRVRAISDSDYAYFHERELIFGRIEPGETKSATLTLTVGAHELSRTDRMSWQVFEQYGAPQSPASLTSIDISGQGLPRPSFDLGWILVDDPKRGRDIVGNGDGVAQVGERVRLQMTVRNSGAGPALDAFVSLRNFAGDAVFFDDGRLKLGKLGVGEVASGELTLEIRKLPKDGKAAVQINVVDSSIGESLSEKALIPMSEQPLLVVPAKGWIKTTAETLVRASPLADAPIIARAAPDTVLASEAKVGAWTRVTLPDGKGAFIDDTATRPADGKASGKTTGVTSVLAISPPRVNVVGAAGSTDAERIHLSGVAEDTDGVRDVFITVVNPSRDLFMRRNKVFYQAAQDPTSGKLEFSADVPLEPGNNLVEVHARQNEDVIAVHRLWILRTSGLEEARSAARKSKSNGKLSVDTLGR